MTLETLANFSIDDYSTSESQNRYIQVLFSSRQADFGDNPTYFLWDGEHSALVKSFFKMSGYGPNTKLGQLVQVIACEDKQSIDVMKYSGKKEILHSIEETLDTIRKVRDEIADEIFGDRQISREFVKRIRDGYIYRSPEPMTGSERSKRRKTNIASVVEDVNSRFPLTSR